jgi:hypothetical protein
MLVKMSFLELQFYWHLYSQPKCNVDVKAREAPSAHKMLALHPALLADVPKMLLLKASMSLFHHREYELQSFLACVYSLNFSAASY